MSIRVTVFLLSPVEASDGIGPTCGSAYNEKHMSSRRWPAGVWAIFVLVIARGGEVDKDTFGFGTPHYWLPETGQKPRTVHSKAPGSEPIDAFILEGLREKHLTRQNADREHLIRA